jgi:YD repeat-containing protein
MTIHRRCVGLTYWFSTPFKQLFLLLTFTLFSTLAQSAITLTTNSANNDGNFTLSWTADGNNQFFLYNNGMKVSMGGATSHALSNLDAGTYTYQVDGCYSFGCGYPKSYTLSNSVVVTVTESGTTVLSLSATQSGGDFTLFYVTNDPVHYAGRLNVYENGTYIGSTTNAKLDVVNKPIGTYSYYLRNCNPGGCYPNSNALTVSVIKDAEQGETLYRYDVLGRLVTVDDHENGLVIYEYDAAGNRKAIANN